MVDVTITKVDDAWLTVACGKGPLRDLAARLTFEVPGARFSPRHVSRGGYWDGKKRLLSLRDAKAYAGLAWRIADIARSLGMTAEVDSAYEPAAVDPTEWIRSIELPADRAPRDYQLASFIEALTRRRAVIVSPTGSGKSMVAYLLARWVLDRERGRTLIVVPKTNLVRQMATDFAEYGYQGAVHQVAEGASKGPDGKSVVVATWQSIYEMPPEYFGLFDQVIGDEAHNYKADCLVRLMTSATEVARRVGMTGSLDGSKVNELVLEGLFGPVFRAATTSDLMERGDLAKLDIRVVQLVHSPASRAAFWAAAKVAKASKSGGAAEYQAEVDHLSSHSGRNRFLVRLACEGVAGNSLVLTTKVAEHAEVLHDMAIESRIARGGAGAVPQLIVGRVKSGERERIRALLEQSDGMPLFASYGTMQEGANIRRLHNVIFGMPTKSRIRTLQSIGRGLRLGKESCTLWDVCDDMTSPRGKKNNTLLHMEERMALYAREGFKYEFVRINLGDE